MSMIETQILEKLTDFVGVKGSFITETSNWLAGTVDGGPNGDGAYPFTDRNGHVVYIPCPARQVSGTGGGGLSASGVASLKVAVYPGDFNNGQLKVLATGKDGGQPLRIDAPTFFHKAIIDFERKTELIGDELLPAIADGRQGQSAELREIYRLFSGGVINPCLPPFNVKMDARRIKPVRINGGTNLLYINPDEGYDAFRASDVGKQVTISNAGGGGYAMRATVTEFIDAKHVRLNKTAGDWAFPGECDIGTDNTAGLQAALNASRQSDTSRYGAVVLLPPGMALTGPLIYQPFAAICGMSREQTTLAYRYYENGGGAPLLSNGGEVAFNSFLFNIGLQGSKYLQLPGTSGADIYYWQGAAGAGAQDPRPFMSHVNIDGAGQRGMVTRGRHSGTILAVDISNCQAEGWINAAYDVNIMNILCIANGFAGYSSGFRDFNEGAANCNVMNMKLSFNGQQGYRYDPRTMTNMSEMGSGNNYSNMRLQESNGHSLMICNTTDGNGGAQWNKFGDLGIDDTGCLNYPAESGHGARYTGELELRAMVCFSGNTVFDNHITVAYGGPAVHAGVSFASHGIYATGDCSRNSARLIVRGGDRGWYNPAHMGDAYRPQAYLNQSSGGTGSNDFTINGVHQA